MEKHATAKQRGSRSKLSVSTRPSSSAAASSLSSASSTCAPHRLRIWYQDEAFRTRSQLNAKCLMISATSPSSAGNAALVAQKALKYRKVLERIGDRDVSDPAFDVWELLRVDWCKQPSLKPQLLRKQSCAALVV